MSLKMRMWIGWGVGFITMLVMFGVFTSMQSMTRADFASSGNMDCVNMTVDHGLYGTWTSDQLDAVCGMVNTGPAVSQHPFLFALLIALAVWVVVVVALTPRGHTGTTNAVPAPSSGD